VQYHKLIEDTRGQIERNWERTLADRLWRRALFELFPHPGRLRALAPLAALQRALPAERMVRRFPRLRELTRVAPRTSVRAAWRRLPERTAARGTLRGRVGFLQGCVQRVFFGDVNTATVEVLAAEGFEVFAPRQPRCCGALQLHTDDEAIAFAQRLIATFEPLDLDAVVVNAAGCGSSMKDYGWLLRDDPAWAERAAAFTAKVRDVSELLAEHEPVAPRHPVPLTVAYHDACHLAHAQGVREAPRRVLGTIPGLELREPAEWEICCGSAGVYNLLKPDAAAELGRRKARNLLDCGAQAVAAANPGCALQIAAHARALGRELPVHHPMELLYASIQGRTS
jgi:glycolate oxidase iron-sulfur subunit